MANILSNQKNGKVVLIDTGSNSSIALSALRVDDTENVVSASIRRAWFSSNGNWVVARGSNTVLQVFNTDHWDFADHGASVGVFSNATVAYTLTGNGTIMLELQKSSVANT